MTNQLLFIVMLSFMFSSFTICQDKVEQRPNIIYILADDLGYGDLSSYGQKKFQTPNIDKLAENGIKFAQHYSGSAVCAPSRSSLMTGQHTGHTPIRGNKGLETGGQLPLPDSILSIAELMKNAGYVTGMFGKWGLGFTGNSGDPSKQGFDEFYGYKCQVMAHRYYPPYLWHNQEKDSLEGNDWINTVTYSADKIQKMALNFINSNKDKPFFAYIPYTLPHAEIIAPNDSVLAIFDGKFEEDSAYPEDHPYASSYGPNLEIQHYAPQDKPYAMFAAMVTRMDIYVGQIMDKLNELGIADNTIVMFASDNGPHTEGGANPDFFNSARGLRGVKRDLYEGGIRSPFIVSWPGKVEAGRVTDHISAFWDIFPTFADIINQDLPIQSDGISLLPTLLGKGTQKKHDYLYWEMNIRGGRQAVRMGDWKGVIYGLNKGGDLELYNLNVDRGEQNDIAENNPEIVKKMKEILNSAHIESKDFPLFE